MKRLVLACLVLLGAAVAPSTAQAAASGLRGYVCQTSSSPAKRAMSITAVMRPLPGSMRLSMRFQLFRRTKRVGPATSLTGSGLKTWITPRDPTLGSRPGDIWVVKHPVVPLTAPAYYRLKVTFRWLDSAGNVVGERTRRTPTCFQPQLEPDLKVVQGWPVTGKPGHYYALVRNGGPSTSGAFTVEAVSPDDGTVLASSKTVASLAPHTPDSVWFQDALGRPCPASGQLDIIVKPSDPMDDADPGNNAIQVPCPNAPAAPARATHGR